MAHRRSAGFFSHAQRGSRLNDSGDFFVAQRIFVGLVLERARRAVNAPQVARSVTEMRI